MANLTTSLEFPFDAQNIIRKKKAIKRELLDNLASSIDKKIAILGASTTSEIKDVLDKSLQEHKFLISSSYYRSSPRKFKILFSYEDIDQHFSLVISNVVRYSDLINSNIGRKIVKKEEIRLVS